MPTDRRVPPIAAVLILAPLCFAAEGCDVPRPGTQIGALRKPDPSPTPPTDLEDLDLAAAVTEAMRIGGVATLGSAWSGHLGTLDLATAACPGVWVGPLPEDLVDADMGEEAGMSWASSCETDPGRTAFAGFSHWDATVVEDTSGTRTLVAEAEVTDGDERVLYAFDGEASDTLTLEGGGWTYTSLIDGTLGGELTGAPGGLRTGGELEVTWSSGSAFRMFGTVTVLDGFGPTDRRSAEAPEVADLPDWEPGQPRFTSIRFDLEIAEGCAEEPVGYVGLRGNEGFWFDVYFLPKFAEDDLTFEAVGFPYEQIDNVACDGVGTLFARNIDLRARDAESDWSREVAPDFGSAVASLQAPTLPDFVYTLRNLPQE